jgi:hypothetical protein
MSTNRTNRELETRETEVRKKSWVRPEVLPSPHPEPGYKFRWIRISTRGEADPMNVSSMLRQMWEPVKAADHPEIFLANVESDRFKDNIVIGGLMLCKAPEEAVDERNDFYLNQAEAQIRSVDQNFMRENDPRMPLFNERKTKVSFGRGS